MQTKIEEQNTEIHTLIYEREEAIRDCVARGAYTHFGGWKARDEIRVFEEEIKTLKSLLQ